MAVHRMNGWWNENDKPVNRCRHLGKGHAVADGHCLKTCPHFKSFQKSEAQDYVLCGFPDVIRETLSTELATEGQ